MVGNKRRWRSGSGTGVAAIVLCAVAAPFGVFGCSYRSLLITQDPYINNASHRDLSDRDLGSEPLEVSIVCVHPEDLEKQVNHALKPGQNITCRDWYERRPTGRADENGNHFDLPREQVYVLTDRPPADVYGQKRGPSLKGAARDGRKEVRVSRIRCVQRFFRGGSVMYVFPRFIDKGGKGLPAPPVMFRPRRTYADGLSVKIGVHATEIRNPARHYGQYIEDTSQRRRQ